MKATAGAWVPFLVFVLLSLPAAAAAGQPEPYLVEYRAYHEALKAGNKTAAIEHGRAAWQAAEQGLGDHRLTAILAYNYGVLVVFTDASNADAALQRVHGLLGAGIADVAEDKVSVYAAYARFIAHGKKRRDAGRLREALTAVGLDATGFDSDLAPMWLQLASYDLSDERYRKALAGGKMAEAAIRRQTPGMLHPLAQAIAIQGIAQLVPYPRKADDIVAAHEQFLRALEVFPLQDDIDSFDPLFAEVYAWDAAAGAARSTIGASAWEAEPRLMFGYQADPAIDCNSAEWEWEREAPAYPRDALSKGYLGAVLLGFRIGDDLRVTDARILAEVPKAAFGAAALEAVKSWRVTKIPKELDPVCVRNVTTTIHFILEE